MKGVSPGWSLPVAIIPVKNKVSWNTTSEVMSSGSDWKSSSRRWFKIPIRKRMRDERVISAGQAGRPDRVW